MATDPVHELLDDSRRAEDRIASAFEVIADTLAAWYKLEVQRFEKDYPVKLEPKDATITRVPSADDKLRADQGASDESLEDWVGLREQGVIDRDKSEPSPADDDTPEGGPDPTEGQA